MRYARIRGGESPPPIFSDFRDLLDCSFRIANFGLMTSGSPTCWHLEMVVKARNASFTTLRLSRFVRRHARRLDLDIANNPLLNLMSQESRLDGRHQLCRFHNFRKAVGQHIASSNESEVRNLVTFKQLL
jgi:hypothetical protein